MIEHLDIACPEFSYFKKHGIGEKKLEKLNNLLSSQNKGRA